MNSLSEQAVTTFQSGLNCAQSILLVYTDTYNINKRTALSLSCGFGGGMGRLQETCGAVTGAFMVIGLHNCQKYTDNKERKEKTYAMIQEFDRKFRAIYGTTNCKTLLNCDLKTAEGHQYWVDNHLNEKVCAKCIADAVRILEEIRN